MLLPRTIVMLLIALVPTIGCDRDDDGTSASAGSAGSSETASIPAGSQNTGTSSSSHESQIAAALEEARRQRAQPSTRVTLPNYPSGPLDPRPVHVNFYEVYDHYPGYLLCTFDVNAAPYEPGREAEWLEAALGQVRKLGPGKFPRVEWVAVIIANRAEHKDAGTFVQSRKVGAVFPADKVFGSSGVLEELVSQAVLDRAPFAYDDSKDREDRRQRWLVVERHSAMLEQDTSD